MIEAERKKRRLQREWDFDVALGKRFKARVTRECIRKGKAMVNYCPIALALENSGFARPMVNPSLDEPEILANFEGTRYRLSFSRQAQRFARRFDRLVALQLSRRNLKPFDLHFKLTPW